MTTLDSLNALFNKLRPPAKVKMLDTMAQDDPALKAQWDTYIAGHQQAFSDAHPPVAPLAPVTEQAIRQQLTASYPDAIVLENQYAPVDCDGASDAYGDVETDVDTSVHVGGKPLNADDVLYHVCTMDHQERYGMLAINFYGGRMLPTVFGDEGPRYGEASHLAIQMLGMYSSPIDGGARNGHDMYLIPGLGAEFMARGLQPTPDNLLAFCREKGIPGF